MKSVPVAILCQMWIPSIHDTMPRSEVLNWAPIEAWINFNTCSSFPASNLSSTYTGIMIMDLPHWKVKTQWSACVWQKLIQIRKSCRVVLWAGKSSMVYQACILSNYWVSGSPSHIPNTLSHSFSIFPMVCVRVHQIPDSACQEHQTLAVSSTTNIGFLKN